MLYASEGRSVAWASNTCGKGDSQTRLMLQNDSTLVLHNGKGRTLWTSARKSWLLDGVTAVVKVFAKMDQ